MQKMTHLEQLANILILKNMFNDWQTTDTDQNRAMAHFMQTMTGLKYDAVDIKNILKNLPSKKYVVKALIDKGLSQKRISEMLGVSQPAISLALSRNKLSAYHNAYMAALEREQMPMHDDPTENLYYR